MTAEKTSMRVIEIKGEMFRYRVESRSDPDNARLVDLSENYGNGFCSCEHYGFTAQANLRRRMLKMQSDAKLVGEECTEEEAASRAFIPYKKGRKGVTECQHIRIAREYFHKKRVRPLLHAFKKGIPKDAKAVLKKFFNW